MPNGLQDATPTIIPTMRYRDAPAAIEWLCRAFGFERHLVVPGPDGAVAHAELSFGGGMIMLGSHGSGEFDLLMTVPSDAGGRCTQSVYVVVADVDGHHGRAVGASAEIIMAPRDQDFGGRSYICRDPEGHVWSFGSYDPRG